MLGAESLPCNVFQPLLAKLPEYALKLIGFPDIFAQAMLFAVPAVVAYVAESANG